MFYELLNLLNKTTDVFKIKCRFSDIKDECVPDECELMKEDGAGVLQTSSWLCCWNKLLSVRPSGEMSLGKVSESGGQTQTHGPQWNNMKRRRQTKLVTSTLASVDLHPACKDVMNALRAHWQTFQHLPHIFRSDCDSERQSLSNRLYPAALNWNDWNSCTSAAFIASSHKSSIVTLDFTLFVFSLTLQALVFLIYRRSKSWICTDAASMEQGIFWRILEFKGAVLKRGQCTVREDKDMRWKRDVLMKI